MICNFSIKSNLKRKVSYIKNISKILKENYDYDIPTNKEDLCSLPGVGEKIANCNYDPIWISKLN